MDGIHKGIIICPECNIPFKGQNKFFEHVRDFHPDELWEDFEDDGSEQMDEVSWRGFSSEENARETSHEVTSGEADTPPRATRLDKGKGRAVE